MIFCRFPRVVPFLPAVALLTAFSCLQAGSPSRSVPDGDSSKEFLDPPDIATMGTHSPGIIADYTFTDSLDFEDGSDALDLRAFRTRVPLLGFASGDTRFGISVRYEFSEFETDFLGSRNLHSISLGAQITHLPQVSGWMGILRFQPAFGFEDHASLSEGFDGSVMGVAGYRFSRRFAAGLGVYANWAMEDFVFYPTAGIVWYPTNTTFVQITPPLVNLAWSPFSKWTFFINAYPSGKKWALDENHRQGQPQAVDFSLFRSSAGIRWELTDHLRLSVRGGFTFLGELEVRDSDQRVLDDDDLDSAPFGAVTLNWVF